MRAFRIIGTFLILASLPLTACSSTSTPDLSQRDTTVASVMKALHTKSSDQLVQLAGAGPINAADESKNMVKQWGGVKASGYTAYYSSEFTPAVAAVDVVGTAQSGAPIDIRFSISWHDDKWLLNIGTASPDPNTALPTAAQ